MAEPFRAQRPITVHRAGDRYKHKPKPKRWSHQDFLTSLKGKVVRFTLTSGSTVTGNLIDADQFSLFVSVNQSELIYFKHEIRSIGAV